MIALDHEVVDRIAQIREGTVLVVGQEHHPRCAQRHAGLAAVRALELGRQDRLRRRGIRLAQYAAEIFLDYGLFGRRRHALCHLTMGDDSESRHQRHNQAQKDHSTEQLHRAFHRSTSCVGLGLTPLPSHLHPSRRAGRRS